MKTFKFKDLAVTVNFDPNKITLCRISNPSICPNPTVFNCPGHSFCHWPTICPIFTCGGCSVIACSHLPSYIPTDFTLWKTGTPYKQVVDELEEAELKEFKTNLAELQRYVEVKIEEAPRELDLLEKKLQEAIEELRAQRENG